LLQAPELRKKARYALDVAGMRRNAPGDRSDGPAVGHFRVIVGSDPFNGISASPCAIRMDRRPVSGRAFLSLLEEICVLSANWEHFGALLQSDFQTPVKVTIQATNGIHINDDSAMYFDEDHRI
jgi:hypothetical protein